MKYDVDAKVELYDLENDAGESKGLSGAFPGVQREFVALFEEHGG